eukprot:6455881-Amphidinium_carterae.2
MRLTTKQPSHRLWVNNKEVQQPPDLDQQDQQKEEYMTTTDQGTVQPRPGLDTPVHTYAHPTAMQRQDQTISNQLTD